MHRLVCLIALLASIAEAKQVEVTCPHFSNEVARCELHGLPNGDPHWRTTINGRIADHEKGIVVYLTVDEHWRGLEIYVTTPQGKHVIISTVIRYDPQQGRVVFGKEIE